jgi:hypothetical protein
VASSKNMPLSHGLPDDHGVASTKFLGGDGWPRPLILLCALLANNRQMAQDAATGMTDVGWNSFTDLVIDRHRVASAIAEAVRAGSVALPDPVLKMIRAEARANGFAALAQRAESLRLAGMLEAVGIYAICLKGWPLAEQLYGGPGMRHSNDIDFLVTADQRMNADRCLRAAGYIPLDVHKLRARLVGNPAVRAECKDVAYQNMDSGLVVEMHWRTSTFRGWPELSDLDEAPVPVSGIDGPVGVLAPGSLGQLVYLSLHGQQHLFGRLKWLLDIARLTSVYGPGQLADCLLKSERIGAGRAVRLALHLAHRVFEANVPEKAHYLPCKEARWVEEILAEIADPSASPGQIKARLGFYRWHLRMAETPAQFIGVLRYGLWRGLRLGLAGLIHRAGVRLGSGDA